MTSRQMELEQAPAVLSALAALPRRVALYSHDTQGLGHIRRNISIASAIVAASPHTDVLLLTGNPEATQLPLPPHTDIITLPTVSKDAGGRYRSRTLSSPLGLVVDIRCAVIAAALTSFRPDLLIVDKVPLGFESELVPALRALRRSAATQVVLGLREILDEPSVAIREWRAMGSSQAVLEYYDDVWVYGDQGVYDPVAEYGLPPEVAHKVTYTGYLSHGRGAGTSSPAAENAPPSQPYVLCLVGGGQDGYQLAERFVSAPLPAGHLGVVLTGPFMSDRQRQQLQSRARVASSVQVLGFVSNADAFIGQARAVVSMAGYNSVCELLAQPYKTLLVPRVAPRTEQLIRAGRLADRGLADIALPGELTEPVLGRWLADAVSPGSAAAASAPRTQIDLDGLARIAELVTSQRGKLHHAA